MDPERLHTFSGRSSSAVVVASVGKDILSRTETHATVTHGGDVMAFILFDGDEQPFFEVLGNVIPDFDAAVRNVDTSDAVMVSHTFVQTAADLPAEIRPLFDSVNELTVEITPSGVAAILPPDETSTFTARVADITYEWGENARSSGDSDD